MLDTNGPDSTVLRLTETKHSWLVVGQFIARPDPLQKTLT